MFRFEKLEIWQKSIAFADRIYDLTRAFPIDERFALVNQMRRAAVSIASNIAEGTGRTSDIDFSRFLEIAYGSLMEVLSQVAIAQRREYLNDEAKAEIFRRGEELARMLSGLKTALLKDIQKQRRPPQ